MVSAAEVQAALSGNAKPVVLDVRLPEDFAAAHLPGARHACVFQVDFPEVVKSIAPDPATPLVVYGAGQGSLESQTAAEKLERLGYLLCADFRGGLDEWRAAGFPVDGTGAAPVRPPSPTGTVALDPAESQVVWIGRNLLNRHWGTVALSSGRLEFARGRLVGGGGVLDLRRIECRDLAGSPMHDVLIAHLESDDFFDVARFPEARFEIDSVRNDRRASAGGLNLRIAGTLSLRGQSHPVTFPASAGWTPDGRPAAQATLAIDRTRWGVLYGSGRFFRRLAGHLVNDLIELQFRLVGEPVGAAGK